MDLMEVGSDGGGDLMELGSDEGQNLLEVGTYCLKTQVLIH